MHLQLNTELAKSYKNPSQIARILTEDWISNNGYCPYCATSHLHDFPNNRPVADFYCCSCNEEFELKSKKGSIGNIIADGAYDTMIARINASNNPNFFFMSYTKEWVVRDLFIVPKHFFSPKIIIKRKPLPKTAKRAGWTGCNIHIEKIPSLGKISLVKNEQIISPNIVQNTFQKTLFLREQTNKSKGWILDIMYCIDTIPSEIFNLEDIYQFETILKQKHPQNNFIKDKIRQQLQVLRDKGLIEFIARGKYKKIA